MKVRGKMNFTHVVAYRLLRGEIPHGLLVCHKCDNPPCCNPDHLFLGTPGDNAKDSVAKGRNAKRRGEDNPLAKLSDEDVRAMRRMYSRDGATYLQLAASFGVSRANVSMIVRGVTWRHVEMECRE